MEFVSPMQLACARRVEYRAENGEPIRASVDFASGRQIDVRRLRGTLNRATRIDYPQLRKAAPADRSYIQAEMDAILLAWLGALESPVFNPAQPSGWAGSLLHPFAWALHAQRAGFATPSYRCGYAGLEIPVTHGGTKSFHIVFGGRTFPQLSAELERAAVRLSDSIGIPLLGITLAWAANGQASFDGASPTPDLRVGGAAFLNALSGAFTAA